MFVNCAVKKKQENCYCFYPSIIIYLREMIITELFEMICTITIRRGTILREREGGITMS